MTVHSLSDFPPKIIFPVLLCLFFLSGLPLFSQANPFLSTEETEKTKENKETDETKTGTEEAEEREKRKPVFSPYSGNPGRWVVQKQKQLQDLIADILIPEGKGSSGALLLFGGAFLYGLLHALGPGHRKIILTSYFLAEETKLPQGVLTALAIGLLHGGSALLIIFSIFYIASGPVLQGFNSLYLRVDVIAYLLLIIFGVFLLIFHIVQQIRGDYDTPGKARNLSLIVISGLVPCPGAATVLILSLSVDAPFTGALLVMTMSLGMGTLLIGLAIITIFFREAIVKKLFSGDFSGDRGTGRGNGKWVEFALEVGGAAVMVLFGLFMLAPYLA